MAFLMVFLVRTTGNLKFQAQRSLSGVGNSRLDLDDSIIRKTPCIVLSLE